ncbi:class I adenylate-forming enzyme family protein [Zwartia sp.]|uniref:class I adenylate-forming enzyme family protein n=1 Tax=Zwartia sp. TaxID=2978004 RepID=UPI003BB2017C
MNSHASMPISWSNSLQTLAKRFGDDLAAIDGQHQTLSYNALNIRAHALAKDLLAQGLQPGDPVATLMPNSVDAVWVSYGVRLAGACETPLSWSYTQDEIEWCAQIAQFKQVISLQSRKEGISALGLSFIDAATTSQTATASLPSQLPAVKSDTSGRILFTSGTTGKPKGVLYTHGARWQGEQLLKASLPFVPERGARILLMTPFVHGSSLLTFAWLDHGGTIVLHDGVQIDRIEPLLESQSLAAIFAPPTVLAKITGALAPKQFPSVRCVFTGTQPLTPALYQRAHAMFGAKVRITFGKSECVNPITILDRDDTHAYFNQPDVPPGACVGWPATGVEIKIEAPTSEDEPHGEVWLRSPHMSAGLIDANGFRPHLPEGWHNTGDLGYVDAAGRVILTGRVADVIKTGGYRVNPDEIEADLASNPLCGQICVTSLASDYWGEIIIAVGEGTQAGWQEACEQLVAGMSKHKRPRLYVAVSTLPRNPQGKISRRQVSRMVLETHTLADGPYPSITAMR